MCWKQARWLHAEETGLQKQFCRGRTVLYVVGITRGFLLPSSWPLCLCVALPHPLSVALRKATCVKLLFDKLRFNWAFIFSVLYMYVSSPYKYINVSGKTTSFWIFSSTTDLWHCDPDQMSPSCGWNAFHPHTLNTTVVSTQLYQMMFILICFEYMYFLKQFW